MRVKTAARRFDRTHCRDAYSGVLCFMGQLGLYDDSHRDSESTERRTLSTAPESVVPARRVVLAAGVRFIIGHGFPDTYRGEVVRMGYVAHEATHLAEVRTLGQACRGEGGLLLWGGRAWVKNSADERASSNLTQQQNLHFAVGEPLAPRMVIGMGSDTFIVRDVRDGPAGTLIAFSDRLQADCIELGQITTGTWDPINEVHGAPHEVRVLKVRWQSLYDYRSATADKLADADLQFVVDKVAHTAQPGQDITLAAGVWQIKAVESLGDVWLCSASRHA
jgi:hypothetical protein